MRRIKRLAKKFFWPWIILGLLLSAASAFLHYKYPDTFFDIWIDKSCTYVLAPLITGVIIIGLGFMDEYDRTINK